MITAVISTDETTSCKLYRAFEIYFLCLFAFFNFFRISLSILNIFEIFINTEGICAT